VRRVLVLVLWILVAVAVVGWYVFGSTQRYDVISSNEFTVSGSGLSGQTPAMEEYLQAARHYYLVSNEADRLVIRTLVLRDVAGWDLNKVEDPSLTAWVIDLRKESGEKH
jgi:hypothetical protein